MLKNTIISKNKSIKDTMRLINENTLGTAFIVNADRSLFGVVTDGDIRRSLIEGISLNQRVADITKRNPLTINRDEQPDDNWLQKVDLPSFPDYSSLKIPVLNKKSQIVDLIQIIRDERNNKFKVLSTTSKNKINKLKQKRVLLIGGAGYLGSVLCQKLLKRGYRVTVLDSLLFGKDSLKDIIGKKKFRLIKGDVRLISNVVEGVKNADAIIYLAALVGDPASAISPKDTLEINYHSVRMAADIAKYYQIQRFIFASTCSVYGQSKSGLAEFTEESPMNPLSLYARTKIETEKALLELVDANFSPTILRMATLYGLSPRMRFDLVVNGLSAKAHYEGQIPIFGGLQYRPLLHVEDAADAYIACLEKPLSKVAGEIFNIGTKEENYQIIQLGEIIKRFFPKAVMKVEKDRADRRDYFVDFSKAKKHLNYRTKKVVDNGIAEIREAFNQGMYKDFFQPKYNNYKFLIDHRSRV